MSIFSNIWETIKSIPSQYQAAYQIGTQGMADLAKQKLTAAVGIQPQPTLQIPIGQNLTPQATQQAYQAAFPSTTTPSYTQFAPQAVKDQPFASQQAAYQTYYQPSVTTGTTGTTTSYPTSYPTQPTTTEYTPPPQAPSGAAGTSYQTYQPSTQPISTSGYSHVPYQAPSGVSGTSFHTGLLGGVSSGLGLPVQTTTDKDKDITIQQQGAYINPQTQQSYPMGTASPGYTAQGQPMTPAPQAPMGVEQAGQQAGYQQQAQAQAQAQCKFTKGLSLPSIITPEGSIDLGASQAGINQITDLMKSPLTQQSRTEMLQYLDNSINVLTQVLQQAQPLPQEPMLKPEVIADDQDQLDRLQKYEKEQYENIQRSLGIPQAITDYENAIKELQATDQAFNAIIQDVNDDPDFPKGLARRRIQEIEKEKGVRMTTLQNKIGLLQQSLTMKQEEFKERMGITQRAISREFEQQQEQKQSARNQLSMLMDTGAISNMSDTELYQLAQASGYTFESLKKIKEAITSGNQAKITKAEADLEKQQQDMELARQREARLAGGGTGGGTDTGGGGGDTTQQKPLSQSDITYIANGLVDQMGKDEAIQFITSTKAMNVNGSLREFSEDEVNQMVTSMGGGTTQTTPTTSSEGWLSKIAKFVFSPWTGI